jgi:DICT domain-containing protein/predicted DNA-binding transcriptional regulator AlpA
VATNPSTAPGDADPVPSLTIGDLAARTGLTTATLRAWESRHGFPTPVRLSSGHRRYSDRDVALVQQVLHRKEAGVRLESAIAEAATARRTPTHSVYAELRRSHPHLPPERVRKSTLLALTRAMEDECCARAQQPTLFAGFQAEVFYRRSESRWRELARTSRAAVVMADFGGEPQPPTSGRLRRVHLPEPAPLRREWTLVCDAADHPAALAGWEVPGQDDVRDRDRVFELVWTLEPQVVREAARVCAELATTLDPDAGDFEHLHATAPGSSDDLRGATTMFARLVSYVDRAR